MSANDNILSSIVKKKKITDGLRQPKDPNQLKGSNMYNTNKIGKIVLIK